MRGGTTFLYKLTFALVPPNVVLYIWMMVDYLAHPLATSMTVPAALASPPARALFALLISPTMLALGALIMRHAPGNVVGILITLVGLVCPAFTVGQHTSPLLAALQNLMVPIFWVFLIYMVLFFPDGHAYPRWAESLFAAIMVYVCVSAAVSGLGTPVLSTFGPPVPNRLHVPALAQVVRPVEQLRYLVTPPLIAGMFISPILRYRATVPGSRERQQIKWLAFCACVFAVFLVVYLVGTATTDRNSPAAQRFIVLYIPFVTVFPSVTLALAIIRHKLYNIDVIIRRTLVYSLLSAALALIYFGSVVVLQRVANSMGGQDNSPLAVVVSTLAIAALFQPLRRRIQAAIDRRFYRRKYDAARIVQAFSTRLSHEVDLSRLTDDLVDVVHETLHPAHVSIWLRRPEGKRRMRDA